MITLVRNNSANMKQMMTISDDFLIQLYGMLICDHIKELTTLTSDNIKQKNPSHLVRIESLTENSLPICQFIRIEFNERILEVFGLGDDPVAVGVVATQQFLGFLSQNAVTRLWMCERLKNIGIKPVSEHRH